MPANQSAGNIAATTAAAQTPTGSSGSSNLGKYFMVAQGLSALMGVAGGLAGMGSSNSEASALNQQADLALEESRRDAALHREKVLSFREDQAQAYNSSGVLLEGSPMVVLSDTIRKGNMEIDAIMKRGQAMSDLYRLKAKQTKSGGGMGLLGSLLGAGAGLASSWILGKKIGLFGNTAPSTNAPAPGPAPAQPLPPVALPNPKIGGK